MSIKSQNIAFIVLIGGKSTRFGSDKGIFEFLGKPLLSYQLEITGHSCLVAVSQISQREFSKT